jgi:HSP20 family protein
MNHFFNNDYFNHLEEDFKVAHPKANIVELDKEFSIELVAPGFDKNDFSIEVEDDRLRISAKVENQTEDKKTEEEINYLRREYQLQSVERNFKLSHKIDSSKISASYQNGILKVQVPKKEEAIIKRSIAIQ